MPNEEVTSAAFLTPDRWRQAHRSVGVLSSIPARAGLLQQIELDDLAAAAGTYQRCCP